VGARGGGGVGVATGVAGAAGSDVAD